MNGKEMFDKMSNVSTQLVESANNTPKRPAIPVWARWCAAAACICLVITGVLVLPALLGSDNPGQNLPSVSDGETPSAMRIIDGSDYGPAKSASYKMPSPGGILYYLEVRDAMADYAGTDAKLFVRIILYGKSAGLEKGNAEYAAEIERMTGLGYDVFEADVLEHQGDGVNTSRTNLVGLFTVDELEHFRPYESYGYAFCFLYNDDGSAVDYSTIINAQ